MRLVIQNVFCVSINESEIGNKPFAISFYNNIDLLADALLALSNKRPKL